MSEDKMEVMEVVESAPQKAEAKEPTLAERVAGVEAQLVQAMLEAVKPILEENGYSGFKDVRLLVSQPDEEGRVQQSLRVSL